MNTLTDRMVWIDIETTGLFPDGHVILELGIALTNPAGQIRDMQNWVLKTSDEQLEYMPAMVREMHTANLLLDELEMSHTSASSKSSARSTWLPREAWLG